jgi:hypothetical protein
MLEKLFADAPGVADDEQFTHAVVQRTRSIKWRALLGALLALGLLLAVLWAFSVPLGDWALLTVRLVATPLVNIPDGWWNWILAPINTLGTALVVLWRVLRLLSKRAIGASYVN